MGEDWKVAAPGLSSSSASSEMSQTLGAPEWAYESSCSVDWPRGLLVRLGERSGDDGRPGPMEGERARWPAGLMTVGSECARIMGGATTEPLLEERRWRRE